MRNLGLHRALAGLFLAVSALSSRADGRHAPTIPKQYIVEFSKGSAVSRRDLESAGIKLIRSYNSEIFTGAAIEVLQDRDAQDYADAPHVVSLWPNRAVPRQAPRDFQSFSGDVAVSNYTTLRATGVEQLHEAGILGHGVKVGVLDSGIWYDHPDLGGGFGPGFKVAGGWDFVGDGTWPDGPKEPGPDPKDPLDSVEVGHGTHVAGIIAAEGKKFVGVAPKANLYAYKIMAHEGTDDATTVDAFLRAFADGMDVITLSVTGPSGWSENAVGVVASRIVRAGVVVTIPAGNDGDNGAFYANTAAGLDVLAVSSVQAETAPGQPYKITYSLDGVSNTTVSGYISDDTFPPDVANWPVVALNLDPTNPEDACAPYPASAANLTGVVALVRRGGCDFFVKQQNLEALGAKYILVYNDGRALTQQGNTDPGSLLGMIPESAGRAMVELIRDGGNVTVDFSYVGSVVGLPDPAAGGLLDTFTTWGGTYELQLKPDIAAPGGNIFSTWVNNSYAIMSGTSMSAPYVAGIAALYIGACGGRKQHGPDVALAFNRRVLASGASLQWFNGTQPDSRFIAPPLQVGAGLVNAVKVLYANTTLDPVKLHLNDTANFQRSHELTVANHGPVPVTYNFTLEPAAGLEIFDPWIRIWNTFGIKERQDLVPMDMVPDVQFPDPITVGPGESKKVVLTFVNPENKGWNATVIPTYSGKVVVAGSNGEQLSVPYMGVASDLLKHKPVFQAGEPTSWSGPHFVSINNKSSYTFNLTKAAFDFPQLEFQLDWGARELRWDIFKANWSESEWRYPPTSARGFVGSVARFSGDRSDPNLDLTNATVANQTVAMPETMLPRNGFYDRSYVRFWWLGQLASGSQIRPGHYTMRVAASKPFGSMELIDGWEVWRREIQVLPLT